MDLDLDGGNSKRRCYEVVSVERAVQVVTLHASKTARGVYQFDRWELNSSCRSSTDTLSRCNTAEGEAQLQYLVGIWQTSVLLRAEVCKYKRIIVR